MNIIEYLSSVLPPSLNVLMPGFHHRSRYQFDVFLPQSFSYWAGLDNMAPIISLPMVENEDESENELLLPYLANLVHLQHYHRKVIFDGYYPMHVIPCHIVSFTGGKTKMLTV